MAVNDGTGQDAALRKKLRLLKIGLYGFVASLILAVFFMFFTGAVSLLGLVWTETEIIETAGSMIGGVIPVLFAAPFFFFGILFASLMMNPRETDMAQHMKPSAGALAVIIAAGVALCALPILAAFVIAMAALYLRGSGIIFLAMAYFGLACLVFFLSVSYAMIRDIAGMKDRGPAFGWVRKVFRVLRVDGADSGPMMDGKSHRALSRIERIIGSSMGLVLFLIFQLQNIYETARSVAGHGSDKSWLDVFAAMDTLLALFALFIIIFSTLFIIRSIKTVFRVRGGVAQVT
ncbi:MAG TPA: hypothetical protein PLM53_05970 [Spirochaetota bacterium]|nr:hypothetical protein [Spirochaetota bacterium]HPC43252.1 hypothetical protein [Spirochaetota bacterium]HPL18914.1 hypothetical protein [Spirochaetota bacterium]HQF10530.1 hypothetical protein [Spirochaetota bacterium]HQH96628.1 hypothetical protein [Spirochaetota bacterium]